MTTRNQHIKKLTDELTADIDLSGADKVRLLKSLMLDRRQEERNEIEVLKLKCIDEHRKLLLQSQTPDTNWLDGPRGVGRRLLTHDNPTETPEPVDSIQG